MRNRIKYGFLPILFFAHLVSCTAGTKPTTEHVNETTIDNTFQVCQNDTIVDANYTFEEAIAGTKAPKSVIDQLVLFDVVYQSTDGKIHRGQILTNKKIEKEIQSMFVFMLENNFVIEKAIPIVHYNWDDNLSMDDNNTYSFCYRNISYSKHARGMAIDINPRFNPLRWKKVDRPNQPAGAVSDTTINGTLHPNHVVVKEFKRLGFRWGHVFSKYWDDHHFDK